jgi:hypothetical protein
VPPGKFIAPRSIAIGGSGSFSVFDLIIDLSDPGSVTLADCAVTHITVRRGRHLTTIRARWELCGGLVKPRLKARLEPADCDLLDGWVQIRNARSTRQNFHARRSRCGDLFLDRDAGEECDIVVGQCPSGRECILPNRPGECRCGAHP